MNPFPLCARILTGLILCKSYVNKHSCRSSWVWSFCHIQKTLLCSSPSWPRTLTIFPSPLSKWPLRLGRRGCDTDVTFVTKYTIANWWGGGGSVRIVEHRWCKEETGNNGEGGLSEERDFLLRHVLQSLASNTPLSFLTLPSEGNMRYPAQYAFEEFVYLIFSFIDCICMVSKL